MIVWLNGTFGAGKTTTAKELTSRIPDSRLFDAEKVGEMLWHVLGVPDRDFQDFPPWRGLVVETARQVLVHTGGLLVVTQTVLVEQYWTEIHTGLTRAGVPVRHFLLHADQDTLVERIETDTKEESTGARQWRLDHLAAYQASLPWLRREAEVIDTVGIAPHRVADIITASVANPA
ncbi:AAA family ATPase [Streptomyces sp. SID4919]|uniref:AAA family ATPase n=1 Tax=unclassified Streptomyces TaxID=2593676 RepID=UPI000823E957|nr:MULTISPECIES: AAA family ATPase [unclassified Streptomyces]MYY09347.1 AAA family ATPase [Streptomyces sp. SID4919]SCK42941.1 shikimate kinase [Streptomyces sp. AmelKG-E11A]